MPRSLDDILDGLCDVRLDLDELRAEAAQWGAEAAQWLDGQRTAWERLVTSRVDGPIVTVGVAAPATAAGAAGAVLDEPGSSSSSSGGGFRAGALQEAALEAALGEAQEAHCHEGGDGEPVEHRREDASPSAASSGCDSSRRSSCREEGPSTPAAAAPTGDSGSADDGAGDAAGEATAAEEQPGPRVEAATALPRLPPQQRMQLTISRVSHRTGITIGGAGDELEKPVLPPQRQPQPARPKTTEYAPASGACYAPAPGGSWHEQPHEQRRNEGMSVLGSCAPMGVAKPRQITWAEALGDGSARELCDGAEGPAAALRQVQVALAQLSSSSLAEFRTFRSPPRGVQLVGEAVALIAASVLPPLGSGSGSHHPHQSASAPALLYKIKPLLLPLHPAPGGGGGGGALLSSRQWDMFRVLFCDPALPAFLTALRPHAIPSDAARALRLRFIEDPGFTPEAVSALSLTAGNLCLWCHAVYRAVKLLRSRGDPADGDEAHIPAGPDPTHKEHAAPSTEKKLGGGGGGGVVVVTTFGVADRTHESPRDHRCHAWALPAVVLQGAALGARGDNGGAAAPSRRPAAAATGATAAASSPTPQASHGAAAPVALSPARAIRASQQHPRGTADRDFAFVLTNAATSRGTATLQSEDPPCGSGDDGDDGQGGSAPEMRAEYAVPLPSPRNAFLRPGGGPQQQLHPKPPSSARVDAGGDHSAVTSASPLTSSGRGLRHHRRVKLGALARYARDAVLAELVAAGGSSCGGPAHTNSPRLDTQVAGQLFRGGGRSARVERQQQPRATSIKLAAVIRPIGEH